MQVLSQIFIVALLIAVPVIAAILYAASKLDEQIRLLNRVYDVMGKLLKRVMILERNQQSTAQPVPVAKPLKKTVPTPPPRTSPEAEKTPPVSGQPPVEATQASGLVRAKEEARKKAEARQEAEPAAKAPKEPRKEAATTPGEGAVEKTPPPEAEPKTKTPGKKGPFETTPPSPVKESVAKKSPEPPPVTTGTGKKKDDLWEDFVVAELVTPEEREEEIRLAPPEPKTAATPATGPPRAAATPRPEPNEWEERTRVVMQKMWNWFIYGSPERPTGDAAEFAIAKNWLTRVGIVIIVTGIVSFLRYSIEHGWISPTARVLMIGAAGATMILVGTRLLGRVYHILGEGLIGGGLAALYASIYAAYDIYNLIDDPSIALVMMTFVTVIGIAIAIGFDSLLVAVLATLGGLATPLLLPMETTDFVGLNTYLTMLALITLGTSLKKEWPWLRILSFVGTYVLLVLKFRDYTDENFHEVFYFWIGFYLIFSISTLAYHLINKSKTSLLEINQVLIGSGVFLVGALSMLVDYHTWHSDAYHWSVISLLLGTTVYNLGLAALIRFRELNDQGISSSLFAVGIMALGLIAPMSFTGDWLSSYWAIMGVTVLFVGRKIDSKTLTGFAIALFFLSLGGFAWNMFHVYGTGMDDIDRLSYLPTLMERIMTMAVPVAAYGLGAWRFWQPKRSVELTVLLGIITAATGVLFTFSELYLCMSIFRPTIAVTSLFCLAVVYSWIGIHIGVRVKSQEVRGIALAIMTLAVSLMCLRIMPPFYLSLMDQLPMHSYEPEGTSAFTNRLLDRIPISVIILAFMFDTARLFWVKAEEKKVGIGVLVVTGMVGFFFTSAEVYDICWNCVPELRLGSVSVLWTIYALALIWYGILRRIRPMRIVGLVLFGVVSLKVYFVDLASFGQLYRVGTLIALGVLILAGSLIYMKYEEKYGPEPEQLEEDG